jgi:hypothetical protein
VEEADVEQCVSSEMFRARLLLCGLRPGGRLTKKTLAYQSRDGDLVTIPDPDLLDDAGRAEYLLYIEEFYPPDST